MICKKTELTGFRNIEHAEVEFSDGVNVLVGGNAEGKTNMLEAIYLFALGKSFRGAKEEEIIGFGRENASAAIFFKENARSDVQKISVAMQKGKRRRIEVNGVKINRLGNDRNVPRGAFLPRTPLDNKGRSVNAPRLSRHCDIAIQTRLP